MLAYAPVICLCLLLLTVTSYAVELAAPDLANLKPSHPRLILTDDEITTLSKTVADNPLAAEYLKELTATGEKILQEEPVKRELIGPRLLQVCRKALDRITNLALLYKIDGDPKWAKRAVEEMRAAAAFSDWNPQHFLDVAEMTAALGIGYDWLYDTLSPDDRKLIKNAIIEKGLNLSLAIYENNEWWTQSQYNWNNVCNGGMIIGALAIADEEPKLAKRILDYAAVSLPYALATYAPDGAWPEGPGYWQYATRYTVTAACALRSALGTDLGIMEQPGMKKTGYYPWALTGPTELFFNFADSNPRVFCRTYYYALARWYRDPAFAYRAREVDKTFPITAFDIIWFDPSGSSKDTEKIPLDNWFERVGAATFRSSWTDRNALFVGFKAGSNAVSHSHLDLGSFILEADGVRWADELGPDDYNLPDYFGSKRFTYYRLMTQGHNTLLLDSKNQERQAEAPVTVFETRKEKAFAIADLTAPYKPAGALDIKRGIALIDSRSRVLVQDELHTESPVDVVWSMHTRAQITIHQTGTRATLTLDGKTLNARICQPAGATFSQEEVKLDPPHRPLPDQRKLIIRLPEKTAKTTITVLLTPGKTDNPPPSPLPLDEWK